MWWEAAQITLVSVLAIQMGLVEAIEETIHYKFRILSCPKCCVLWVSLGWHLFQSHPLLESVFVSFLSSYASLWLCLMYDAIAIVYNHAYEKINPKNTASAETESGADAVS